ncbi:GTPase domain-containing protein [Euzebya tangerina]|uniref:GTPase domain-containing protein n=1 Tax=Euzebya tangerina TaxID=591198 RepID=UPI0013C304F9|nr:GTPase domain-containing protein [Euzebya tangerina]
MASHSSDPVVSDATVAGSTGSLMAALDALRQELVGLPLTGTTPSARRAARARDAVANLISKAVEPSAAASPPLRVAVVGATGVGKSTLLNALSGSPVATVSAVRPTTTAPVWVTASGQRSRDSAPHLAGVDVVQAPGLPPGLMLVEVPDPGPGLTALVPTGPEGDPVLPLDAWDVHLVVTSTTRYGDQTLWERLAELRDAEADVVIVMTKVAAGRPGTIHQDLRRKARALGLGDVEILSGSDPATVLSALSDRLDRRRGVSPAATTGLHAAGTAGLPLASLPRQLAPVLDELAEAALTSLTAQAVTRLLSQLAQASRSSAVFADIGGEDATDIDAGSTVHGRVERALVELRGLLQTACRELPPWYRRRLAQARPGLEVRSSLAADVAFERDVLAWLARFDPPRTSLVAPTDVAADPSTPTVLVVVETLRSPTAQIEHLTGGTTTEAATALDSPGLAMCRELARVISVAISTHLAPANGRPAGVPAASTPAQDEVLRRRLDAVMEALGQP